MQRHTIFYLFLWALKIIFNEHKAISVLPVASYPKFSASIKRALLFGLGASFSLSFLKMQSEVLTEVEKIIETFHKEIGW